MNMPLRLNMLCDKKKARVLNIPGIYKVLNMREYALEQYSNISEYV